jgi:hypothetical protein
MVKGNEAKIDVNFKNNPIGYYDGVNEFGLFDKKGEFTKEDEPFFSQNYPKYYS